MFVWKNGMNLLLYPSKQRRFSGLRFLVLSSAAWQIALKKGIDNFRANLYLGFRRRLKGLAKLNFSRSEVGWVISPEGQPKGQSDLKKPTALRGVVGV